MLLNKGRMYTRMPVLLMLCLFIAGAALAARPSVSFAGWGDMLDQAGNAADKLVTERERARAVKDAVTPAPSDEGSPAAPGPGDDNHYIQPDDYFINDNPLGNDTYIWVRLAKMVTPPSASTKHQGEFFQIRDANNIWTKYYWKTRIASVKELRLGTPVICFNDRRGGNEDSYMPPESKEQARGGNWFMAKVTDMSDLYRHYITVSGNYKINVRNLRIIVK